MLFRSPEPQAGRLCLGNAPESVAAAQRHLAWAPPAHRLVGDHQLYHGKCIEDGNGGDVPGKWESAGELAAPRKRARDPTTLEGPLAPVEEDKGDLLPTGQGFGWSRGLGAESVSPEAMLS